MRGVELEKRPLVALFVSVVLAGTMLFKSGTALSGELGPSRVVEALRAQESQSYQFVVTFRNGAVPDMALPEVAAVAKDAVPLDLVNGYAVSMRVSDAFSLAKRDGVDWVWYLHPEEAPGAIRVLQGLDYTVRTMPLPNLANLSLGPPSSFYQTTPDHDAPVPRAIEAAAARGLITIVAVGNTGASAPGFVNPWSTAPYVISVGAWDHRTGKVWTDSSTASPDQREAWPDVVAPGVDVIGPWTSARPKPEERRVYDEGNARFREQVPKEDWDKYTMMTGTSQAAAVVSGAAAQVLRYLKGFIEEHGRSAGDSLFSLEAGPERISAYDGAVPRLTGTAKPTDDGGMVYEYWLDAPWKLVKQIIVDTAVPVADADPWQAGAGLVDPNYVRAQFGAYGVEPPKLLPVKVQ